MQYDVLVVGGGIGGLAVAALLSARGVSVCLLERNSRVGGCISRVEYSGHDFEPGMGLYPEWGPGEIYDRIFSELAVEIPETQLIEEDYVVRISPGSNIRVHRDASQFAEALRIAFPECAESAISFYELVDSVSGAALTQSSDSLIKKVWSLFSVNKDLASRARSTVTSDYLKQTSERFRQFVDGQLRAFVQTSVERCAFLPACRALSLPRQKLYAITGGPATVAERLAEAIKKSGGTLRLDSPVLRLAYHDTGDAVGVDLLSGERVIAKRAIVSNLTIWDTYGKLIGLDRTPPDVKKLLTSQNGGGVYQIYASMEQSALARLPAERFLVCTSREEDASSELTFATNGQPEQSAPKGKLAVTLKTSVSVDDWFMFQSSEEDYEAWDQEALERVWNQLHAALPELGGDIEVIETANPRTFYDETRRKLGMVMGVERTKESLSAFNHRTAIPNVFMVGDTISESSLAAVTRFAAQLANILSQQPII